MAKIINLDSRRVRKYRRCSLPNQYPGRPSAPRKAEVAQATIERYRRETYLASTDIVVETVSFDNNSLAELLDRDTDIAAHESDGEIHPDALHILLKNSGYRDGLNTDQRGLIECRNY